MAIMGVDAALAAAVGGGIQGQIFQLIKNWQDNSLKYKLAREKLQLDDVQRAREVKNTHFMFTRRTIAIMFSSFFCFGLFYCAVAGIPIVSPYVETNGFILWMFRGSTTTHYMQARGLVVLPCMIYALSLILTMYFGGGGSKNGA